MRALSDIRLSQKDRRAIEAASKILRERLPVARLVLFGSKARGNDEEDSDIDLLILVDADVDTALRRQIRNALYGVQREMDVFFGEMVVAAKEWDEGIYQAMPIHYEIDREGALL
jgi:predicted nucleotidyltransferase